MIYFDPQYQLPPVTAFRFQPAHSAETLVVLGGLASNYADHTGAVCTIVLYTEEGLRSFVIRPGASLQAVHAEPVPADKLTSTIARHSLDDLGRAVGGVDWIAVPITMPADWDDEVISFPGGVFVCQYPEVMTLAQREEIQIVVAAALESLAAHRRIARLRDEVEHVRSALTVNRDIGVAIGIIVASRGLTSEEAFVELQRASRNTGRKVYDVAVEVIVNGDLVIPGRTPQQTANPRRLRLAPVLPPRTAE